MHLNSLNIMKMFIEKRLPDKELKILDLGSRVVKGQEKLGSYKQFLTNKKWQYVGADTEAGENVDVVIKDGYKFPFKDEEFDVVVSGQTLEHIEFPWMWMTELARILKKGGLCCIIAPAVIHEHKYPIDTYRYYPDGMKALAKWSGLTVLEVQRTIAGKRMEDTCLVASKSTANPKYKRTLQFYHDQFKKRATKFNRPGPLPDYFKPMIGDKKEVVIGELAAGPFCTIGNSWPDVKVKIYASDVLQHEYAPLWELHKMTPIVPVEYQDMEQLTYPDKFFDIVHCANALDHTLDPKKALREMLRVCKTGGWIYFHHSPNQRKKYRGMHEWDINEVNGETIFSNPKETFSLSEFGDFKTHTIDGGYVVSILHKKQ